MCPRLAKSSLLVGILLLVSNPSMGAREDAPSGTLRAGTRDSRGAVYWLDQGGTVTVGRGVDEAKTIIEHFPPRAQLEDVGMDGNGNLVVAMMLADAPVDGGSTRRARLGIYDPEGRLRHEVKLRERWWPQRVGEFRGHIAVLGSSPEDGYAIDFVDSNYRLLPDARIHVSLECGALDLLDMAVDPTGIWVVPLERCENGYVVQKYDADGKIVTELSGVLEPFAGERPEGSVTPALKGLFATSEYVGVILNRVDEGGILTDLWTPSGEFVKRVTLRGIRSPFVRMIPTSADDVDVLDFEHGAITSFTLSELRGEGQGEGTSNR